MPKVNQVKLQLASPEQILKWSERRDHLGNTYYAEVTKPDTINYRTYKAENNGLFAEQIFGPVKDYECKCGKLKRMVNKGKVCPDCGVEVQPSSVRREWMGHIRLNTPIAHIWYVDKNKGTIARILNMKAEHIYRIVHFDNTYVVLDANESKLVSYKDVFENDHMGEKLKSIMSIVLKEIQQDEELDEETKITLFKQASNLNNDLYINNNTIDFESYSYFLETYKGIRFGIGSEAIKELLLNIDLDEEIAKERKNYEENIGNTKKLEVINKRLELLYDFNKSGNKPEWMIFDVLPVLPADLRPIIPLDGGRFTTSEINDLYRRVINRNNKVKKAEENFYPKIMVNEVKRMLQVAVNELLDAPDTAQVKKTSLVSKLKSKRGRFRQNLLGKRVDFSGRSVIVVGPELQIQEMGLPKKMALELFKPFIIGRLLSDGEAPNIKVAKRMVQNATVKSLDYLDEVIENKVVLLNRAPTLHRLGIQAFHPKLVEGKAMKLHPLVCAPFNADFDGDQMAIHLPVSKKAQEEAKRLMLSAQNVLLPKDSTPAIEPSQDMILGNYFLTFLQKGLVGEGKIFGDVKEILTAIDTKRVHIHSPIILPISSLKKYNWNEEDLEKYIVTTPGRVILNEVLPRDIQYISDPSKDTIFKYTNEKYIYSLASDAHAFIQSMEEESAFRGKDLSNILSMIFSRFDSTTTSATADAIKKIGFEWSTKSGISLSAFDINPSPVKKDIVTAGENETSQAKDYFNQGLLSSQEVYNRTINIWTKKTEEVRSKIMTGFDKFNPVLMMSDSGARGNLSNFTQLVGIRGLMSKSDGSTLEVPVKSSFREGLSGLEFFLSTHGSRKGTVDTALNTGQVGYLTRTLVDAAHDIIVREEDCCTDDGAYVSALIDDGQVMESLADRIYGRYSAEQLFDNDNNLVLDKNVLIDAETAQKIDELGFEQVKIRVATKCETLYGVCSKCYGIDPATRKEVEVGAPVGVIAAQSIGEPSTQLTMRTFHTGGVASGGINIVGGFPAVLALFKREPKYDYNFKESNKSKIGAILLGDGRQISNEVIGQDFFGKVATIENISFVSNDGFLEAQYNIKKYHITFNIEGVSYVEEYRLSQYHILSISKNDTCRIGYPITNGIINHLSVEDISKNKTKYDTIKYRKYDIKITEDEIVETIISQIQVIYRKQGIELTDKHFEVIVMKVLGFVELTNPGGLDVVYGPGSKVITKDDYRLLCKSADEQGVERPVYRQIEVGIGKEPGLSALDSFLDTASYERTAKMLSQAAIRGKVDKLIGLKENVIIGNLIPAGTGLNKDYGKNR